VDIQPHQIDIDELNSTAKNSQLLGKTAASQLDDVTQRWMQVLQRVIDTKV